MITMHRMKIGTLWLVLLWAFAAKAGADPVEAQYQAARAHYDANRFDEAIAGFAAITRDHPSHPLAVTAAHLHLDTLNMTKDYEGLRRAAADYLGSKRIRDPDFVKTTSVILQQLRFKECNGLFARQKTAEAGACFERFVDAFPKSPHLDTALFNAAVAFATVGEQDRARRHYLRLLKEYPQSALRPKALFALAMLCAKASDQAQAAKLLEQLARRYPKDAQAADATMNAAFLYEELGDKKRALSMYTLYLQRYGKQIAAAEAAQIRQAIQRLAK
mgnify:CR=1 FL=1